MSETEIYILISAALGFLVGFFAEFLLGYFKDTTMNIEIEWFRREFCEAI